MKKLLLSALVIGLAIGSWIAYGQISGNSGPAMTDNGIAASRENNAIGSGGPATAPPLEVRVRTIAPEPMVDTLILQGRTVSQRSVRIRSEVAGRVEEIFITKGDFVEAGQPILRLSSDDREARVVEAQALVRQRQSEFEAAQSLNQRGIRSNTEVDQARAALESARATLATAELAVDRMVVTAPFSGVLDDRSAELGAFLDRGEEIGVLVDLDPLRVRAQVAERNLGHISRDATAQVRLVDGRTVDGRVTFIGAIADERTRTFAIEVEVPNENRTIIENLTAEIRLTTREVTAHKIEASLLALSDDGVLGIKAIGADDQVVFHPIDILSDGDGGIWISGLPDNDVTVITVGQEFVLPGQQVIPVQESEIVSRAVR